MMKKGFTLLEALVAISIILVSIAASFSIVPQGQIAVNRIRNRTTANYLAQEALEVVRHKRDNGMYFSGEWFDDLEFNDCRSDADTDEDDLIKCMVDTRQPVDQNQLIECVGDCDLVNYEQVGNERLYGHFNPGPDVTDSIFTRWVTIQTIDNEEAAQWQLDAQEGGTKVAAGEATTLDTIKGNIEVKVKVHVAWQEGLFDREMILEENLFNWLK